jgi:predicted RNase H-like HicB family nuclease
MILCKPPRERTRKVRYLVIIEKGPENLSAYVPDLPGCTSAGKTFDETMANIREAIEGHLEVMREYGEPIPESVSEAAEVEVEMAV